MISEEGIEKALEDIELLKKENESTHKELKQAYDALLTTQRCIAYLQVRVIHNESLSHKESYTKNFAQFASEASGAMVKIGTSNVPLSISEAFERKRWKDLESSGAKTIKIDL